MIGQTISHYKILEKLGEGGMGVVYKARDTNLDRTIAIKLLPHHLSTDEKATKRFIREAKAASALDHSNIGTIYEIDKTDEGLTFIAMAYYDGETLRQRIDRRELSPEETFDICSQIASGLEKAHNAGIVHRDIKPSNIMITSEGQVKIIDFGMAKLEGRTKLTRDGTTLGTAAYMSPEQARGMEVDGRSDIFSLGTILYEMIAGKFPFHGKHEAALLYEIVHEEPEPLSKEITKKVPVGEMLIRRSMAKDPAERYQSIGEFIADIELYRNPAETGEHGGVEKSRRWRSRSLYLFIAFAFVLAVFLIWQKTIGEPDETGDSEEISWFTSPPAVNWILIADFDGPDKDPALAQAVRGLVESSLSESRIVTPLSRVNIKQGLRMAMLPDTTEIVGDVAMELAYRAGAEALVEGKVERVFGGYAMLINVIETMTGDLLFSIRETSEDDPGMFPAMERLGTEMLKRLGENAEELARQRRSPDVSTGSLEAYKLYEEAIELHGKMKYTLEMKKLDMALSLDPDFTEAWHQKGIIYSNWGLVDSSRYALNQASSHRKLLSEKNRLRHKIACKLFVEHEYEDALELSLSLVKKYNTGYNGLGVSFLFLGKSNEALEVLKLKIQLNPFGASDMSIANVAETATLLGRYEEAREYIDKIEGNFRRERAEMQIALAQSRWQIADSIFQKIFNEHGYEHYDVNSAMCISRGSASKTGLEIKDYPNMRIEWFNIFNKWNLLRIAGIEMDLSLLEAAQEKNVTCLVTLGIQAAAEGDADKARNYLEAAENRPSHEQNRFATDILVLKAWIEKSLGNYDKSVRILTPYSDKGQMPFLTGRLVIRWLIAEALESSGKLTRAAEAYEAVISPLGLSDGARLNTRPGYVSMAHQRLTLLYSRLGRKDDARIHLAAFEKMFTDPDPELMPLLAAARAAVSGD